MGQYEEAAAMFNTSFEVTQRLYGHKNIDSARTLQNIAVLHRKMENYESAVEAYVTLH